MPESDSEPVRLFCSYSHKDNDLRAQLEAHLALLRRRGKIQEWHDSKIGGGEEFENIIDQNLEASRIILLLVSHNFFASDYCYDKEMTPALKKHKAGEARVIPIILRPVDWIEAPFAYLKVLPTGAKPVTEWRDRNGAWADVSRGIRLAIEALHDST
jgi:hypothetical protein